LLKTLLTQFVTVEQVMYLVFIVIYYATVQCISQPI